jgi:hypothetical protein
VREFEPSVAVKVAEVVVVTAVVAIAKLAVVAPPGTVTLAGDEAAVELSDKETTTPPVGAAALKVTVPVDGLPPATVVGLTDKAVSVTVGGGGGGGGGAPDGLTVSVADRETPLKVAVSVTTVDCATANVRIRKSAKVPPNPTDTRLDTTTAASLLLVNATVTGPSLGSGAGMLMRTLPIDRVPAATAVGLTVRSVNVGAPVENTNGLTFIEVDRLTPPRLAVIVTGVTCVTPAVVTPNTVALCPASTFTVAGTEAAPLLDDSDTTAPPAGATPFRITWPIEGLPCTTEIGVVSTEKTASGPAAASRPGDGTTAR